MRIVSKRRSQAVFSTFYSTNLDLHSESRRQYLYSLLWLTWPVQATGKLRWQEAPHSLVTLRGGAEGHGGSGLGLVDDESTAPNRQRFHNGNWDTDKLKFTELVWKLL